MSICIRVKELKGERDRRALGSDNNSLNEDNSSLMMHQRQISSSEEYPNEDEYADDFAESDDPELYNDVEDDDLLLHDEDFPSDGDVNILDEDFPHENHNHLHHHHLQQSNSQPERYQQASMSQHQSMYEFQHQQHQQQALLEQQQQNRRSYEPPSPSRMIPPPTSNNEQKYSRHPLDTPVMASSPEYMYDQVKPQQFVPKEESNTIDFTAQLEDCLFFDPNTIDSFIKFHRAQIREVTEFSKKETKLLANFSLGLSSRRDDDERQGVSLREELKTSSEFIGYLDNLDEVLEMKTAAIEALRDRIRHVLGEEEL